MIIKIFAAHMQDLDFLTSKANEIFSFLMLCTYLYKYYHVSGKRCDRKVNIHFRQLYRTSNKCGRLVHLSCSTLERETNLNDSESVLLTDK